MLGVFLNPERSEQIEQRTQAVLEFSHDRSVRNAQLGSFLVSAGALASNRSHMLAVTGNPRWNDQLIGASELLDQVMSGGFGFLEELKGNFAIAACDTTSDKVVLAVDRMGVERLTYCISSAGLCFGTQATSVRRVPGFHSDVANQSIYAFLFFHMVPSPYTIFDNVRKLPPAHMLEWTRGRASCQRYWRPKFKKRSTATPAELKMELHSILEKATRSLEPDDRTGAFLSGGLDSSTVAGYLSRVLDKPTNTFSIGFDIDLYDELKYARVSASHFNCRSHEYQVTPLDVVSTFARIAETYDEPFGNSSVIPTYYCAKLAVENGMSRLFAGDGGDELFGGNKRYAEQKLFELYGWMPHGIRTTIVEPLLLRTPAICRITPLRKLRRYVEQAMVPLPERLGINFAFRTGLLNMLSEEFKESIDGGHPIEHMNAVYDSTVADSVLDRLLVYDWQFTLADNDLRKVGAMCELAGIEVSYPMLDDDLVEFSTAIPASVKMKGLRLRSFYREAMKGFLHDETIKKTKHGFGLPFGSWLKTHSQLAELIHSNLSDMDSRKIFKPCFIRDVIQQHREGPASFYGYFIWDIAMLEEWLKKHA